ncbi:MAG: site-specific integrase, partial [Candidatus Bathyarchaeota archaeon]|nr:site-specific integrase [Candidatus Bathyarchaeum sp.]
RWAADSLYKGSIPFPTSTTVSLDCLEDIVNFLWNLKKRGYKETSIKQTYSKVLKNIARNCDLNNPEQVSEFIADKHVSCARKELIVNCYINYCKYKGLQFTIPRYKRVDKIPHVPLEKDIEALISALPPKLSIFTRTVKETGARSGEVWSLLWEDIDYNKNQISINYPEKGSRARIVKVTSQPIASLSRLNRQTKYVFKEHPKQKINGFRSYFIRKRKQIATKQCNPRLAKITWKSLRHFKATMEYHRTKDILYVKQILGHVNIQNTLVYTHLVKWDTDDYICKTAKTVAEASTLIEMGFECVTEMDGVKLFRKRK